MTRQSGTAYAGSPSGLELADDRQDFGVLPRVSIESAANQQALDEGSLTSGWASALSSMATAASGSLQPTCSACCNVSDLAGPRERCGKKDTGSEDAGEPTQRLVALVIGCAEYRRLLGIFCSDVGRLADRLASAPGRDHDRL